MRFPSNFELSFLEPQDAEEICRLVGRCEPLDKNSAYMYLVLCAVQFKRTCVKVTSNGVIVGFMSAYFESENENNLFVWQIAVDVDCRGKKLAQMMLLRILQSCREIKGEECSICLKTSITDANEASVGFFSQGLKRFQCAYD